MLRRDIGIKKIVLLTGRCDMRKGINGLAAIVRLKYNLDPLEEGTLFIFCGRKRDRFKALIYEGDGFTLAYKRLSSSRYNWPGNTDEAMSLVRHKDKRTGITYVYESESYWDKEKQQPRARRTLIGKIDEATGEIVPTDGRGRRRRDQAKDAANAVHTEAIAERDRLRAENSSLKRTLRQYIEKNQEQTKDLLGADIDQEETDEADKAPVGCSGEGTGRDAKAPEKKPAPARRHGTKKAGKRAADLGKVPHEGCCAVFH